jgi:hypothetical protein
MKLDGRERVDFAGSIIIPVAMPTKNDIKM